MIYLDEDQVRGLLHWEDLIGTMESALAASPSRTLPRHNLSMRRAWRALEPRRNEAKQEAGEAELATE